MDSEPKTESLGKRITDAADYLYIIPQITTDIFQEYQDNIAKTNDLIVKYENELTPQLQKVPDLQITNHFIEGIDYANNALKDHLSSALEPLKALDQLDEMDFNSLRALYIYVDTKIIPRARNEHLPELAEIARSFLDEAAIIISAEEGRRSLP